MQLALIESIKIKRFVFFICMSFFSSQTNAWLFDEDVAWKEYKTDKGCLVNLSYKNWFDVSYSWEMECEEGKGITGKGKLKQLSSGGDCAIFSGEMVNGYWTGTVHRTLYGSSCEGHVYDSRDFNFPKPDDAKLLASTSIGSSSKNVVLEPTPKATFGNKCVKVDAVKRNNVKQDNGTIADTTYFTILNTCSTEQLFYINFYQPSSGPLSLQTLSGQSTGFLPAEAPYYDSRSNGVLRPQPGFASAPFAGTPMNPYIDMYTPPPPSHTPSPQAWTHLINKGELFQLKYVTNDYPNLRPIEYIVASCDHRINNETRYLFLNLDKNYFDCIPRRPVRVIK